MTAPFLLLPESWREQMQPWGSFPSELRIILPSAWVFLRISRRPLPSCDQAGALKVDVGMANCGGTNTPFLEVCSVGLVSSLFPSADDIQHGNLARVGDFLATLTASPPAEIQLYLENKKKIQSKGHVVLVSNMPIIGLHYQVGAAESYNDGLLDVLFFAELSKLDLLAYVFQGVGEGKPEDPRIQHYHVRRVEINTIPCHAGDGGWITIGRRDGTDRSTKARPGNDGWGTGF